MLSSRRTAALLGVLALTLTACGDEPPPAVEPTGPELERAWRIAVGEDLLDQTVAHIYMLALNSREAPTVVLDVEDGTVEAALTLAREDDEPRSDEDERFEIVVARTMPLAQSLDPEGYDDATTPVGTTQSVAPAAAPEDLTALITEELSGAELFEPTSAVLSNALVMSTITAQVHEIDASSEAQGAAEACEELVVGFRNGLPSPGMILSEVYDCQPRQLVAADEDELVEMLLNAEIDTAVMTASHPAITENSLIALEDAQRAFPQDQYAPVVSAQIADEVPDVANEISQRLDSEALATLRRLIEGEQGLSPAEAAEYWLVEEGFIAPPENWG
ncbi:glycine betaine ABC transporter substrate-binding protein [Nesterenkonia flava]|uniref:Glycine betaine ABC transporter substrate-binding protein n=1 Tax=Nesterenkonia flava TaxID=469799 RepID=A0ABU1FT25_9MICC|nr:glycine betaine ABC transporter substrate-binding protein [Nesterenkonia flava]MDR5711296.1 glycine betaine ABC transporter substrate-binding protein [Nesterenkonia flava]